MLQTLKNPVLLRFPVHRQRPPLLRFLATTAITTPNPATLGLTCGAAYCQLFLNMPGGMGIISLLQPQFVGIRSVLFKRFRAELSSAIWASCSHGATIRKSCRDAHVGQVCPSADFLKSSLLQDSARSHSTEKIYLKQACSVRVVQSLEKGPSCEHCEEGNGSTPAPPSKITHAGADEYAYRAPPENANQSDSQLKCFLRQHVSSSQALRWAGALHIAQYCYLESQRNSPAAMSISRPCQNCRFLQRLAQP